MFQNSELLEEIVWTVGTSSWLSDLKEVSMMLILSTLKSCVL